MLHRIIPACFQDIICADNIALDVDVRMVDGIPHAGLSRQVDHHRRTVLFKYPQEHLLVCNVPLQEEMLHPAFSRSNLNPGKAPLLQADLVIVVHAVQADHMPAGELVQQTDYQICPDEPGCARHQDRLIFQIHFLLSDLLLHHSFPLFLSCYSMILA